MGESKREREARQHEEKAAARADRDRHARKGADMIRAARGEKPTTDAEWAAARAAAARTVQGIIAEKIVDDLRKKRKK